jgi:RNA polymerase sigma-70 factor (ECF subfamily)
VFTHSSVIDRRGDGDIPALVEDVRSGRPAALDGLIARVQTRVRLWATRFTDDPDTADDIAQEVLIGLERRVQRFDGRSKFSTWLFTVTRNVALTQRKRHERRAELLSQRIVDETESAQADPDASRLAELAMRYFEALPGKQRLIFELCDIGGETPAEVARRLGMEQSTVRAHLFKARRAIRARLLEHHDRLLTEYRS